MHRTKVWICLGVAIAAVSCAAAAGVYVFAPIMIYDSNFEAFHSTLSQPQKAGIRVSVERAMSACAAIVAVTNLCWLALVLALLRTRRSTTASSSTPGSHAKAG